MPGRDPVKILRSNGSVTDRNFDQLFPDWVRAQSRIQWTPITVARQAAQWLVAKPGDRILDVGSGVGKMCMVGALTSDGIFTGVEIRPPLVEVARLVAKRNSIKRCSFVAGDAFALDWNQFAGIYLYNPFAENFPRSPEAFSRYTGQVESWLQAAPARTRVVTYHGFGGQFPSDWTQQESVRLEAGTLELWIHE